MKKYLTLIFCSVALAWSGCSENDAPVNTANLTGKWECYKSYDAEYDEWDYDYGEGIDIYRLEFGRTTPATLRTTHRAPTSSTGWKAGQSSSTRRHTPTKRRRSGSTG